jgi:hypothetical protein
MLSAPPIRRPVTWWWFLVPALTCGFGAPVIILIGAAKLRSRINVVMGIGYLALALFAFVGIQYTKPGKTGLIDGLVLAAVCVNWFAGTAHAAILAMRVRGAVAAGAPPPIPVDPALAAAQWRVNRRQEARAIVATNPALAAELRIGRPDLARQYDDGGLVDINHVPVVALMRALDLPEDLARTVVAERDRVGGFTTPDELTVYCEGVTPDGLARIRDRLLFVPL